jgi:four helix bundle protein
MSRDHRKLRVFALADGLVTKIYSITQHFPTTERFGLQMQLRRAAVSAACNIVEGCARRGTNEYLNFLNIAAGSASEARYLVEVSCRLGFLSKEDSQTVTATYTELCARLQALISSLSPEAVSPEL